MPCVPALTGNCFKHQALELGLGVTETFEHSKMIPLLLCPVETMAPFANKVMKMETPGDRPADSLMLDHHRLSRVGRYVDSESGSIIKLNQKRQNTGECQIPKNAFEL